MSADPLCPERIEHGQDDAAVVVFDECVDKPGEIGQGDLATTPLIERIQRRVVPEQGGERLKALPGLTLANITLDRGQVLQSSIRVIAKRTHGVRTPGSGRKAPHPQAGAPGPDGAVRRWG